MPRENVLIVNYEFPPVGGGAGRASYQLARRLVERGEFNCHIIFGASPQHPGWPRINGARQYPVKIHRAGVHRTGIIGMLQFLCKTAPLLRQITRTHPIRLIHYIFSVPTGLLAFVQPKSIPYLISLHGGDVPGFVEGEYGFSHLLLRPFNKSLVRNASHVVAVSQSLATAAQAALGLTACSIIPNGIDPGPAPAAQKVERAFRLCCVARLTPWKRIDLLIKSLRVLPDVKLNVVGTGQAEKALRRLADQLKVSSRVTFSGYVPDDRVREHLEQADAFALPSIGDSFGMVFLEAMAAGLPVIGAESCGVPEVVQDGVNGILVPAGDCDAITEAISYLQENPVRRREYGAASRRIAVSDFSWERVADAYTLCYRDILENCRRRRKDESSCASKLSQITSI
jgi:glycosyltransferase involved in cell wall biosynthesis